MQKWFMFILLFVLNISVWADNEMIIPPKPPLIDTISFQLSAKQWVNTQTALLSVEINATLSGGDIVQLRKDITDKLSQIAKGDWHITRFDRSQDTSGLEKLYVQAETRVGQDKLTNVYNDAKKISKPGVNYAILSVEFKPGLEDMQLAKQALRQQLYQKVNEEITRINTAYGEQHYTLNKLDFSEGNMEGNMAPMARSTAKMMSINASPASMDISVSNELILTALVEVASNRLKGN